MKLADKAQLAALDGSKVDRPSAGLQIGAGVLMGCAAAASAADTTPFASRLVSGVALGSRRVP